MTYHRVGHPHETLEYVIGFTCLAFFLLLVGTSIVWAFSGQEVSTTYGALVLISVFGILISAVSYLAT